MFRKLAVSAVFVALGLVFACNSAFSAVIQVPGNYPTIQQAINAAQAGDDVVVAAGTYVESITMKDGVNVIGAGADTTIIQGVSNPTVLAANSCTLQGFILKGDWRVLYCASSGFTAKNNVILPISSTIQTDSSIVIITLSGSNNIFEYNTIKDFNVQNIDDSILTGISIGDGSENLIKNNKICHITGTSRYPLPAILINGSNQDLIIANNIIYDITNPEPPFDEDSVFGIWVVPGTSSNNSEIINNVIHSINKPLGYYFPYSIGIFLTQGSYKVSNNIVLNCAESIYDPTSYNTITYNNTSGDVMLAGGSDPSDISYYKLQPGSPCIDAGDPAIKYNDPDGSRNDQGIWGGPYAFVDEPTPPTGIILVPGDYPTIQQAIDAAQAGDNVVVAAGTYVESITMKDGVDVIGAGADTTIIQGVSNPTVSAANGCTLYGFTLKGDWIVLSCGSSDFNAMNNVICPISSVITDPNITDFYIVNILGSDNTFTHNTIRDFTIESTAACYVAGLFVGGNDNLIKNNKVYNIICHLDYVTAGIRTAGGNNIIIANNLVFNSIQDGYRGVGAGILISSNGNNTIEIVNNIVYSCSGGEITAMIYVGAYDYIIKNNIANVNIWGGPYIVDYNFESGNPLYVGGDPADVNSYKLQPGSPCIDAGDPAAKYNDLDDSRNDQGIWGGPYGSFDAPLPPPDYPIAVASSYENGGTLPQYAIDDNMGTRWSSLFNDSEWIYVDYGEPVDFNTVILEWETAYGWKYDIQISDDGENWTTIFQEENSDGGQDKRYVGDQTARYVRMQGVERGTTYGYSLYEIKVTVDQPGYEPIATASSYEHPYFASNVLDGSMSTRWASDWENNEWIYIDYKEQKQFNAVILQWEGAYGRKYEIQISDDGENWTTVFTEIDSDGGYDLVYVGNQTARYVKMQGIERGTVFGYSLFEMGIETYTGPLPPVARASSKENQDLTASKSIDDNMSTRWSSQFNNNEWIYVDYQEPTSFDTVILYWETAYGRQYDIQVSDDAQNWTTVYTETNGNGGVDVIPVGSQYSRYVRMRGIQRGTAWGYSLFEIQLD